MGTVTGFAKLPAGIVDMCSRKSASQQSDDDAAIYEGMRNHSLFKLAMAMRRHGCNQETIECALLTHNFEKCNPPLSKIEVRGIAASASRYETIGPKADPIGKGLDESNVDFCPKDISDLLNAPQQDVPWIVKGYLARGRWASIAGPPKVGKTTLTYEVVVNVARGGYCLGQSSQPGKVLILAIEEHEDDVVRRLRSLGAEPLAGKIKIVSSVQFCQQSISQIVRYVDEQDIQLVVVDTLPAWWHLGNENDASEVIAAGRMLLDAIRQTQAAWLTIAHTRKSGGDAGSEIRGSSALLALVDISISMKRRSGNDTMRVLESVSRFSQTPKELVIRYGEEGYEAVGSPAELSSHGMAQKVLSVLDKRPRSADEISRHTNLSKQQVSRALKLLADWIKRSGSGVRGDPTCYRLRDSICPGSNAEEETSDESYFLEEEVIHLDD